MNDNPYTPEQMEVIKQILPPEYLEHVAQTQNAVHRVYFRAGFLAAREYLASEMERTCVPLTAKNIRTSWPDYLDIDPGAPRQLNFEEVFHDDGGGNWSTEKIHVNVEALPIAWRTLNSEKV